MANKAEEQQPFSPNVPSTNVSPKAKREGNSPLIKKQSSVILEPIQAEVNQNLGGAMLDKMSFEPPSLIKYAMD